MSAQGSEDQVAVIVPVFNRPTLSVRALDAVIAQTRPPDMLVIVDDGSTDRTFEVLSNWIRKQVEDATSGITIRLERIEHGGVARARNHAMSLADGATLISFLDSDDVWPTDFLERTCTAIATDRVAVAVSADQMFVPADGHQGLRDLSAVSTRWLLLFGAGIGSSTLFRKKVVVQSGGYDESIVSGADFKLFLDISLSGRWLHVAGAPVQMLRGHNIHGSEAGNLSLSRPDNWAAWAQIASRFVARHGTQTGLADDELLQLISRRWHDAARNLILGERLREACSAYEIALDPRAYLVGFG
jgi:glycosyltransferase involved in cell wall biosynthesis